MMLLVERTLEAFEHVPPVVLAAPYTTSSNLRRHREWTIEEYICEENNRNSVDSSGKAGIDLTPPDANSSK